MFFYFIIFIIIGFLIGRFIGNQRLAMGLMIGISIFWAFGFGPWGFVTFFELIIGYVFGNDKNPVTSSTVENKVPAIVITTEGHAIELGIGGSGSIYVDWGDGSPISRFYRWKSAKEEEYAYLFGDDPELEIEYDEKGIGKEVIRSLYGNGWIRHE